MKCPKCNFVSPDDSKFCPCCGDKFPEKPKTIQKKVNADGEPITSSYLPWTETSSKQTIIKTARIFTFIVNICYSFIAAILLILGCISIEVGGASLILGSLLIVGFSALGWIVWGKFGRIQKEDTEIANEMIDNDKFYGWALFAAIFYPLGFLYFLPYFFKRK